MSKESFKVRSDEDSDFAGSPQHAADAFVAPPLRLAQLRDAAPPTLPPAAPRQRLVQVAAQRPQSVCPAHARVAQEARGQPRQVTQPPPLAQVSADARPD